MSRRTAITCDQCGADEPYDVVYRLTSMPASGDCQQPLIDLDICGCCYGRMREAIIALVTTKGAFVELPDETLVN